MSERRYEGGQIEFHFEYDPGYRLVAANGVWGDPTPRGDLRLDFFVEAVSLPTRVMHAISPEGRVGTELRREPERRFTRRERQGMSPPAATGRGAAHRSRPITSSAAR